MSHHLPSELEKLATDPQYLPNAHRLAMDVSALTGLGKAQPLREGFDQYQSLLARKGKSPLEAYEQADMQFRKIAEVADYQQEGASTEVGPNLEFMHEYVLGSPSTI